MALHVLARALAPMILGKLGGNGDSEQAQQQTSNQSPVQSSVLGATGVAGTAGRQRVVSGGGTLPAPKSVKASGYSVNTQTNQLLDIAVKYLISINSTLKEQLEFDKKIYDEQAMAEREKVIENKSVIESMKDRISNMVGGGSSPLLLGLLAGAVAIGFVVNSILDNEYIKGLKDAAIKTSDFFAEKVRSLIDYLLGKENFFGRYDGDDIRHPLPPDATPAPTQEKAPDAQKESQVTTSGTPYQIVGGPIGISESDFKIFGETIAAIESKGIYDIAGGSGNHYDGKYQMGRDAKIEAGKILGIKLGHDSASREAFRKNPELQERAFAALTLANHRRLMKNPKYANASKSKKLEILAYAHSQGGGAANKWLNTGAVSKDAFNVPGTKYSNAVAKNLGQGSVDATPAPAPSEQAPAPAPAGEAKPEESEDNMFTMAAKFIGNIGATLIGPGKIRNINASLQKPQSKAEDISKASTDVQTAVNYGLDERKKSADLGQNPADVLKIASPTKNISVINPNYSLNEGIMRYLSHHREFGRA